MTETRIYPGINIDLDSWQRRETENRFEEAEIFTARAVEMYKQKLGAEHPYAKIAINNYQLVHNYLRRYEVMLGRDELEMI